MRIHPPGIVYGMLFAAAMMAALLAGYNSAGGTTRAAPRHRPGRHRVYSRSTSSSISSIRAAAWCASMRWTTCFASFVGR